jgi:hypothetical protein
MVDLAAQGYTSAQLTKIPLDQLLSSFCGAVSEASMEMTAHYTTQILALARGAAADGTLEDTDTLQAVEFSGTDAAGNTISVKIPILAFAPPAINIQSSNFTLTVQIEDVKTVDTQADRSITFGSSSGRIFSKLFGSSKLAIAASKKTQTSAAQSTKAQLTVEVDIGPVETAAFAVIRTVSELIATTQSAPAA